MKLNQSFFLTRFYKGVGAGSISLIIGFFQRLLIPALSLKAWGVDFYGEWLLIYALVSNLALSEVGSTIYVVNKLNQDFNKRNFESYRKIFQNSVLFFIFFPLILAFGLISIISFFPEVFFSSFNYINKTVLIIVSSLLALQVCINIPYSLLEGTYRSIGRLPRGATIANILIFTQTLGICIVLYFDLSPISVALIQLIPTIVTCLVCIEDINFLLPELKLFKIEKFEISILKKIAIPSLKFFLIQLSNAISIQGSVIIVGSLLGPTQVVVFSTMRTLGNTIKSPLGIIKNVIHPEFTRLDALNQKYKLKIVFQFLLKTFTSISLIFSIIVIKYGSNLYTFWLKNPPYYSTKVMSLILLIVAMQIISSVFSSLLMATNNHSKLSYLSIASSIILLIMGTLGALTPYGFYGLLFGIVLAEGILLVSLPLIAAKYFNFINPKLSLLNCSLIFIIPFSSYIGVFNWIIIFAASTWWLIGYKNFKNYKLD